MQRSIFNYFKPASQLSQPAGPPPDACAPSTPESRVDSPESITPQLAKKPDETRISTPQISREFTRCEISTPKSNKRLADVNYSTPQSVKRPADSFVTPKSSKKTQEPQSQQKRQALGPSDELDHAHLHYKFLYPPERRDINGRKPEHPDYDETTLHVPSHFLDSQTPALRQWWLIKQNNMDAVLFFKMGKFYEMFNEDAVIAVNNLDLIYMKGDETKPAHAGFPEVSYEKYAKLLIEKGFKVVRIEQTETPAMMEERCKTTGKRGKYDKVVQREICRITTRGTQISDITDSENRYLLSVHQYEHWFDVTFIDTTIGKLFLGHFEDDYNLSKLNTLLAHNRPVEIIHERGNLPQETMKTLMKSGAQLTSLKPKDFWPIETTLSFLKTNYISLDPSLEKLLSSICEQLESKNYLSFGALVGYLEKNMILKQAMECVIFEKYESPLDATLLKEKKQFPQMIIDHIALRNLEIFENSEGGTECTLFESINYCKTHFGQRLLKNWLSSPLGDVDQINKRLDAVETLASNERVSLINEINHILTQTPDLERQLSRLKSRCFKSENDMKAIMFDGDQYSKASIKSFLSLLNNFKRLIKFIHSMKGSVDNCDSIMIKQLLTLVTEGGLYPDYSETLEYFDKAFDHEEAQKTGKIIPTSGVDEVYDDCELQIASLNEKLDEYLEEQKKELRCRELVYFGTAKNRFQIQVPEAYCKRVPDDYRIETTRKGFKRYYTSTVERLFKQLTVIEERRKKALDGIMSRIFEKFCRKMRLWSAAISCMAHLDVYQSIASSIRSLRASCVDVVRPTFLNDHDSPKIHYLEGRHPSLVRNNCDYTPNDLTLDDRLILLSGANMGGKSTLMRQTALMVILAQIGSFVPAKQFSLTPVDRIFSRLGAKDRVLEGESTFYTELIETSSIIRSATRDSLILLDELGRGTSTHDGTAIAYSVMIEISDNIRCRCIFSTHYHTLVQESKSNNNIRLAHMACKVEKDGSDDVDSDPLKETITFLYKITDGPVAKSYGFNVAKLAGVSDEIIKDAYRKANELELRCKIMAALQEICLNNGENVEGDELQSRVIRAIG